MNLTIGAGDFACIVGRSGSGKSTLLNVLATLLTPDTGEIRYEDRSLSGLPGRELDRLRSTDFSMPKKKKAARPRAGRTAKKEKLNLSSIIIVPGDWSKALFDWQVGGSHVPTSVLLAAQSLVGRACIKCGRPARFT